MMTRLSMSTKMIHGLKNFPPLMPSARFLAESKGLDASSLSPGSGKGGRITKGDVLKNLDKLPQLAKKLQTSSPVAVMDKPVAAPSPKVIEVSSSPSLFNAMTPPLIETKGPVEDVSNSKMRKIIAQRLTESKQKVPHFYTSFTSTLDEVLKLRKTLEKEYSIKVSVNDFVIKCSAMALRDVPEINGPGPSIDISVAVATPTGLITPILFRARERGLMEISETVRDLANRARQGKLAPAEYQGGTFTISNLGMYGISKFSAVINPPQAAILAVGGGIRTVLPGGPNKGPRLATLMTAQLSADRRIVDEPTAALFGQAFQHYMNDPKLLLL